MAIRVGAKSYRNDPDSGNDGKPTAIVVDKNDNIIVTGNSASDWNSE